MELLSCSMSKPIRTFLVATFIISFAQCALFQRIEGEDTGSTSDRNELTEDNSGLTKSEPSVLDFLAVDATEELLQGISTYKQYCRVCHGDQGNNRGVLTKNFNLEDEKKANLIIQNGVSGQMLGFGQILSKPEITALSRLVVMMSVINRKIEESKQ
jgi:hypothetical protein